MNYAEEFRKFMQEHGKDLDEISAVWFSDAQGCYPEDYMGDDLMIDIIDKFWYPYEFIIEHIEGKHELERHPLSCTIMPSYEDTTTVVVHNGDRVLLQEWTKAWNFFFESNEDFNKWAEDAVKQIEAKLGYVSIEPSVVP